MAVGGTRSPRADHPMTIALLGGRAQTRPTKRSKRLSSPASAVCGSSKKGQQVEPSTILVNWGLSRESTWTGLGSTPRSLTRSVKKAGRSQNDSIELSSDDDDDEAHGEHFEGAKEEEDVLEEGGVGEEEKKKEEEQGDSDDQSRPLHPADSTSGGTTGSQISSTYAKASSASTLNHNAPYKAVGNQHGRDNGLLLRGNGADLSKADERALYTLLRQGGRVYNDDQGDTVKSVQMPQIAVEEERVHSAQNIVHGNSLESSVSKKVNILLQDLYSEDLLAVQEASQVHYGGAANAWRTTSVAGSLVEPQSPIKGDEDSMVAMSQMSIAGPIHNYQLLPMDETSELDMVKAGEHGKASMDANKETIESVSQLANVQAELVRSMTIGDLQGTIPRDYELKQDASGRDKREAQQQKKAVAFAERKRLLDLDKAEQLRKAEADRASKSQKDPEKTGKSLAAEILRAQRERERERERLEAGIVARDPAKGAGSGKKNCVQSRATETGVADRASGQVIDTPPLVAAIASVSTLTAAPATAHATVRATALANAPATILITTSATTLTATSAKFSTTIPATTSVNASAGASATAPATAQGTHPALYPATAWATSPANTIQRKSLGPLTSPFNSSSSPSQHSATIVGKCAADEPLKKNERASPVPLQDAVDMLRTSLEGCQKRKLQTAMISPEKHTGSTASKKARSNESTSQRIRDNVAPASPSFRYAGTARSLSSTPSGIASPESRKTRMTTPERKEGKRLSALKHRRKKAEARALAQTAGPSGSTTSQGTSIYSSPSVSCSHDREGEVASSPVRIGFAALPRSSLSPCGGNLNFHEVVSQNVNTKGNEKSRNPEVKRDRRLEYQRLKERQRLAQEKEAQTELGRAAKCFTTIADADADDQIQFNTMDPIEVDTEPEEELPRPTTGGKTITQEMLDILQHKPESLLSFVDDSPYQGVEEDATYYEFVVKRLSWTEDDEDDLEDMEPLLCHTGYIDVDAANKAAGDEILLERGDIRVYPLDEFHWKKDRVTGMATYEGSSETGNVRVYVDRVLRPRGQGCNPSRRALKAARRISPVVYIMLIKNTTTTAAAATESTSDDNDELFEDPPPTAPVVNCTVDVCRTPDLANKLASKSVLDRLKAYQKPGALGEIERAELEAEQRKYLKQLEEEELLYSMEPALLEDGAFFEVWVEQQSLKGPCN